MRRENAVVTNLVVFDLDGTLVDTNEVDDQCYAAAWRDEFSIACAGLDWSSFANVSDSGIAEELLGRNGFEVSSDNLRRLESRFVALLERAADEDRTRFLPIAGAGWVIERLASAGWHAVVATGAWHSSAVIKLRAAGLHLPAVPLACCDGRPSRQAIVQHAIDLGQQAAGGGPRKRIVLVGDAEWDVTTARRLSLPFVGIGDGEKRERLLQAGAAQALADYLDFDAFAAALEGATVPRMAMEAAAGR
jgi:phosphoglycolate phosphatase-like HAD superfamily hydrolase